MIPQAASISVGAFTSTLQNNYLILHLPEETKWHKSSYSSVMNLAIGLAVALKSIENENYRFPRKILIIIHGNPVRSQGILIIVYEKFSWIDRSLPTFRSNVKCSLLELSCTIARPCERTPLQPLLDPTSSGRSNYFPSHILARNCRFISFSRRQDITERGGERGAQISRIGALRSPPRSVISCRIQHTRRSSDLSSSL